MQLRSVLVSIVLYSLCFITDASGCGCCPLPKCAAQSNSCSSNSDCECLQMTVTGGGMCANTIISCSNLTPCESDNQTCSVPNTVCVNNTRCNIPVCYPIAQATSQICPPMISQNLSTSLPTTTTAGMTTVTTTIRNACSNGTRCLNNGTCQPLGDSFFCICRSTYSGTYCQYNTSSSISTTIDGIINGSNVTYERTVENVLTRNNWTNMVAVVDVTGSMLPCAAAVYKWITLAYDRVDKIRYYVFFNDGDDKPQINKTIGSAGGIYGIDNSNLDAVLNTMKTAMKNGNGGDGPENDIEALLFAIRQCQNCSNIIHIADNQATPRDMILLSNVTKPVKVIVCQISGYALNTNLIDIAAKTGGSIHTLEQDIMNLAGIPINGTITIGTRTYRRTSNGYVLV